MIKSKYIIGNKPNIIVCKDMVFDTTVVTTAVTTVVTTAT